MMSASTAKENDKADTGRTAKGSDDLIKTHDRYGAFNERMTWKQKYVKVSYLECLLPKNGFNRFAPLFSKHNK